MLFPSHSRYRFLLVLVALVLVGCRAEAGRISSVPDPAAMLSFDDDTGQDLPADLDVAAIEAAAAYNAGGYPSKVSVRPGESLDFHISNARTGPYSLSIYREGATRQKMGVIDNVRTGSYDCAGGYATGCGWPAAVRFTVPESWPSGVYTVDIPRATGKPLRLLFIVRPNTPAARILFLTSVNTFQAYNDFGGGSLYGFGTSVKSQKVSFDRPYKSGVGNFDRWEKKFIVWAEAAGYRMDHAATYDLEFVPGLLDGYDVVIIAGHSEYWTWDMRQRMKAYVDGGGRFMNLSGNTMWWQVRFEDNGRTMVGYKSWKNDPVKTAQGATDVNWDYPIYDSSFSLIGLHWPYGGYPGGTGAGYNAVNTSHWIYAGTGLRENDLFGKGPTRNTSIHDKESDGLAFNCAADGATILGPVAGTGTPGNFTILGLTPVLSKQRKLDGLAMMGLYTTPRGGAVFSAGTTGWMLGLNQPAVNRVTRNVLDRFLAGNFPPEPAAPDSDTLFADRFNCYALNRDRFSSTAWVDDASRLNYVTALQATANRLTTACGVDGSGLDMAIGAAGTRYVASLGPNWQSNDAVYMRAYLNLSRLSIANGATITLFQQYADNRQTAPAAVAALQVGKQDNRLVLRYAPAGANWEWVPAPASGFFRVETRWDRASGAVGLWINGTQAYVKQVALNATPPLNRADFGVLAKTGSSSGRVCLDELVYDDRPIAATALVLPAGEAATGAPAVEPDLYISLAGDGVLGTGDGELAYSGADVLRYEPGAGRWSIFFDGAAAGLAGADVDAIALMADGSLLLSIDRRLDDVPGIGRVGRSDVLHFIPGESGGAGRLERYLNGAAVELTTAGENIDALAALPDGRLLVSTTGGARAGGLRAGGTDLMALLITPEGAQWSLYLDGADAGLNTAGENIAGAAVTADGTLYLTTRGAARAGGLAFGASDIVLCPAGEAAACAPALYWSGAAYGLAGPAIDGLSFRPDWE